LATPPGAISAKGDRDMASDVDIVVEHHIRDFLGEHTPAFAFLGEEEGATGPHGVPMWVLDPVDGTANFVRGLPLCAVSLALIHDDQPVVGVIGLPFLAARYWAEEGQGAYRDGRRIHARNTSDLNEAIVAFGDFAVGDGASRSNLLRLELLDRLAAGALLVRMVGSAAIDLAWLAEGRFDMSITLLNQPWDMAAGVVIAREAGARVFDMDGSDYRMQSSATLATTPGLADQLVRLLLESDRAAQRRAWALRSTASPPTPQPGGSRPSDRPRRP
jgi:myo-inositol-1(or 4)-monophosphatase